MKNIRNHHKKRCSYTGYLIILYSSLLILIVSQINLLLKLVLNTKQESRWVVFSAL